MAEYFGGPVSTKVSHDAPACDPDVPAAAAGAKSVVELIEDQCVVAPDRQAIVFEDNVVTYGELNRRSNQLARFLLSRGIAKADIVAIFLDRSIEMVVALLGILKAGAAYLPLDPEFPKERLAVTLEDAGHPLVLSQWSLLPLLPDNGKMALALDDLDFSEIGAESLHPQIAPDNVAYVIYTSGSTGKPKGVEVLHRGLSNFLISMQREPGIDASDRLLAVTTLSFDIAGLELLLPLTVGASIFLVSRTVCRNGILLRQALEKSGASILQATPATWRMLIAAGWQGGQKLKMLCGGEAMIRELAEQLLRRGSELWNMYGPTETTIWSTIARVESGIGSVSIGKPIDNTQIHIVDDRMQEVGPGTVGELCIGGDGVAKGYLNQPRLTAERFVADPFSTTADSRLYRTGDQARRNAAGDIVFLGRNDHQVKIRGYRIELGDIEDALFRSGDFSATVVLPCNEGHVTRLVAYLVMKEGADLHSPELRTRLSQVLPPYMIPNAFIAVSAMPLTSSGKIDRRTLAERKPDRFYDDDELVAPRDSLERRLVTIWEDILGISPVGVTQDFFALGGDSLLAVGLALRIERDFRQRVPLTALIPEATIQRIASVLRGDQKSPESSAVLLKPGSQRAPLFLIPGHGGHCFGFRQLAVSMPSDQPVYGLNLPGIDGGRAALHTVRDIALQLLQDIKVVQATGPYFLGGHSFGGLVAFEIAHLLVEQNDRAEVVILFDACGENYPRRRTSIQGIRALFRTVVTNQPVDTCNFIAGSFGRALLRAKPYLRSRNPFRDTGSNITIAALIAHVSDKALQAEREYRFCKYDGKVVLLRADVTPVYLGRTFDDLDNGWRTVAPHLEVHRFPCSHVAMFTHPAVASIAAAVCGVQQNS